MQHWRDSRGRLGLAGLALLALLVVAVVIVAAGAGSARSRQVVRARGQCRPGLVPAERGGRACVRLGQPETFQDLAAANASVSSRDTAPFTSEAPGAYLSAVSQQTTMPPAGTATGSGGAWKLVGHPPECAHQTASNSCPPPSPANGNYSYMGSLGLRTLSGRISAYAFDPSRPGRYFAAPVVGGVWESLNGGGAWRSIGDNLPTQTVGAIAYDGPLHRIIVGTGDNSFGGSGIAGHGVYYSDDDGHSWHRASGVPDLILSFKAVVSPADHGGHTVYVATSRGLFRSTNGGGSYVNEKLPTSPPGYSPNCAGNTNDRRCFFANDVTDVVVKGTKTSSGPAGAVIAAVGWRAGQKTDPGTGCKLNGSPTACKQAPRNGLYTSSTGAPGSFKYIPGGSGSPTEFAPTSVVGRTALAVAHGAGQSSDAVYALVQDAQKFNHCPDILDHPEPNPTCNATVTGEAVATVLDGMYASYDFGKTWTKIMDWKQLKQPQTNSSLTAEPGYSPGVQGWYNLWVEADPTRSDSSGNPTRVLFGLEEIWEVNPVLPAPTSPAGVLKAPYPAYPGGSAANDPWVVIGRYWNACGGVNTPVGPCNPNPFTNGPIPGSTTHPDQHAYAMIPDGKGGVTLLAGSDGGAYKQHTAKGQNFSNDAWGEGLNRTLPTVQPYDAEMAKDGTVVSGLQDNGEMKITPKGLESEIYGGDGFFNTIDTANSKNILEEYTYAAQVNLSNDGGTTWNNIAPSQCGSSTTALFATPIEQDPTKSGHVLLGCSQIQEAADVYHLQCADPPTCQLVYLPWTTVYDLGTAPSGAPNIPSALGLRGDNAYVGFCGYCDPATQGLPFANGIATNVGGTKPPKAGTSQGWHIAKALCPGCGTANGKLPERYINSIQQDPSDPNTVYVTLGGYGRRWIPPGSFGEGTSNVGVGHVFVSHDHGEHFTNITGNLPDISANWTAVHNGQLIVATDLGVFIRTSGGSSPTYAVLGTGLPRVPVFTLRISPADPNTLLIATYGRGDFTYTFTKPGPGQPPHLSNLRLSPQRFVVYPTGKQRRGGSTISYLDSLPALTAFTVYGYRHGGWVVLGTFTHQDGAGSNSLRFTGWVAKHPLPPGSYVLKATAKAGGLTSNTVHTTFTIVRGCDYDYDGDCDKKGQV